jgi:hypothetical protein
MDELTSRFGMAIGKHLDSCFNESVHWNHTDAHQQLPDGDELEPG